MGNVVKVSRALRLKLVNENTIGPCNFYLDMSSGCIYYITKFGEWNIGLPAVQEWDSSPYDEEDAYVFESAEAMCKWVAGGRKLEDLQVDAKDEWVDVKSLPLGSIAEVVIDSQIPHSKWVKKTFIRTVDNVTVLETGEQMKGLDLPFMVWPLGPGDSITIEPEKP